MTSPSGRLFLQTPGPTNIPDRVLQAMHRPAVNFLDADFAKVRRACHERLKPLFGTQGPVIGHVCNGHGVWESALVNLVERGRKVLIPNVGTFAQGWAEMARSLGLEVIFSESPEGHGAKPENVEALLRADSGGEIAALCLCHTETGSGVTSNIADLRRAIDATGHDAFLIVDAIASVATTAFELEEWGVDVAFTSSQKGLMLPVGLGFVAVSQRALDYSKAANLPCGYWNWHARLNDDGTVDFYGTPPFHTYWGLEESLNLLEEEGFEQVFRRHARLAAAVHAAVEAWGQAPKGPRIFARNPTERSHAVTAVELSEGYDAAALRALVQQRFGVELGGGLRHLHKRVFRIGHMGANSEASILGALAAVEMGLQELGYPCASGGLDAAMASLRASADQTVVEMKPGERYAL